MKRLLVLTPLLLALTAAPARPADADPTRVSPPGEKPADSRIGKVRTLNDKDFFLRVSGHRKKRGKRRQARPRAGAGRQRPVAAAGEDAAAARHSRQDRPRRLHHRKSLLRQLSRPLRQRQPLSAQGDRQGSPLGKLPGVLCPHGHWANGRFYDADDKAVAKQIESKAPRRRRRGALSAASPLRPAGAHGLRRLPLRHGRLRRQPGHRAPRPASPTPRPSCACKASWACKPGTASAPSISC